MKQIFRFASILMLLCLPFASKAQYFISGGIAYNVLSTEDHTVEVTGKNNYYHGSISIPSTVTHNGTVYDVVALGEEAFYRSTLTNVSIPTSVSCIKNSCFLFATGPSTIDVPASVTEIGELAFAAFNMSSINVDSANPNYRTIDGMLFSKDTATIFECPMGLGGTINLPQSTKHIAPCAFTYCQSVSGITLPEGLTSIGYWAFMFNSRLNNVIIPASVSHIDADIFGGCTALTNLTIASGNTHYYLDGLMLYSAGGDTLLSCHKSADSVFLHDGLRVVGGFSNNSDIRYVYVPQGVTTILDNAFASSSLVSIDLPSNMDLIDFYAFSRCGSLTNINMPSTLDRMGTGCFQECTSLKTINIPDGLRYIPDDAFFVCTSLENITWGNAVETIGKFAFGDCAFRKLQLPPSLRTIRQGAFIGDYLGYLYRLTFTGPVDTIEMEAFYKQYFESIRFVNHTPPVTTNIGCMFDADVDSIFIPCGSLDAWQSDNYWGQFADKYYEDCNGIDNPEEQQYEVEIYPNPANDRLTVECNGVLKHAELVNLLGQTILTVDNPGDKTTLYVGNLERGTYFLRLQTSSKSLVRRVILY